MSFSESKNDVNQELTTDDTQTQDGGVIEEVQIPVEPNQDERLHIENPENFWTNDNESEIVKTSSSVESLTKTEGQEEKVGVIGDTEEPIDEYSEDFWADFWGIDKESPVVKTTLPEDVKIGKNPSPIDTKKDFQEKFVDLKESIFSKIQKIKEDSITEIKMTLFGGKARIKRGGAVSFCYNPELWGFKELDSSVARYFIRNGNAQDVVDNISQFGILDKELIYKILDKATPRWGFFEELRQSYKELDFDEIGSYLLRRGNLKALAENISHFPLINNENIARGLLNSGQFRVLAENMDRFSGLNNQEYVEKFLEAGQFESLALNIYRFHGIDNTNIANRFMEVGQIETLANNLEFFRGLDSSIADTLMKSGLK